MNEDIDFMKEVADMLRRGCKVRAATNDTGEFDCDCPFCDNYAYGNVCRITDDYEYLPKDWEIE